MNTVVERGVGDGALLERVVVAGDLSKLSPQDRMQYYAAVCTSVGLNPLTRPFEYITLNGKLTLYARRDATDQLRALKGVSIEIRSREKIDDLYVVTAKAIDTTGRCDEALGAVLLGDLKGEARANAMMKAETKAKRRVTLSICGLGLMDETEIEGAASTATVGLDEHTKADFMAAIEETTDAEALADLWKKIVAACNAAKDKASGDEFKALVIAKGTKLKEANATKQ